jgi:aldose sugar dehydrogenase
VVVGEMQREEQLQNFQNGPPPDDSGVILRVNPTNETASANNPFAANADEAGRHYAYGIRNSVGFDFDPQDQTQDGDESNEESRENEIPSILRR